MDSTMVSEYQRVADVFARDEDTVETLRAIAATIRLALGRVAAVEETYAARTAAADLVSKLQALEQRFAADVSENLMLAAEERSSYNRRSAAATVLHDIAGRDDDVAHTVLNLFGQTPPDALAAHARKTGPHGPFVAMGVLARYAIGQPIDNDDDGGEG